MGAKRMPRRIVDIAFGAVFVLLMASAVVQEVAHEWLGVAAFALLAVHLALNRRWWARLLAGAYRPLRAVQTVVNLALVACLLGQVASSLVLSEHAFGFLPAFPGASWARVVHLACSYWGFALMAAHAGLHVEPLARRMAASRGAVWLARIAFAAVACFGAWSFVQLGLASYLTLQVQFVFADAAVPLAFSAAQHAAVAVLIGGIAHYAAKPLRSRRVRADVVLRARRELVVERGARR